MFHSELNRWNRTHIEIFIAKPGPSDRYEKRPNMNERLDAYLVSVSSFNISF